MRFVPAHRLRPEDRPNAIACDGLAEVGLHLSHWPGNRTPARWKADLSTEMALRFAADPDPAFRVATNDHHDADGVLALFALLQPEQALAHGEAMVQAAAFGDFQHGEDVAALKAAVVLEKGPTHPGSSASKAIAEAGEEDAAALATEHALSLLPGLFGDPERHEEVWREDVGWWEVSRDALRAGELRVTDLPPARLSVLEWDAECHPAIADAGARGDLLLHVIEGAEGFHYRADWRYYSWADTVSPQRPPIRRLDLEKLLLPLNSLESNRRGKWMTHGYEGRGTTEALRFTNPMGEELESTLQPTEVVQKLAWFLMDRAR
jgi:hypothetical protein